MDWHQSGRPVHSEVCPTWITVFRFSRCPTAASLLSVFSLLPEMKYVSLINAHPHTRCYTCSPQLTAVGKVKKKKNQVFTAEQTWLWVLSKKFSLVAFKFPRFWQTCWGSCRDDNVWEMWGRRGTTLSLPSTPPCSTCEWERIFSPQVEEERATKTKYVDRWDIRFDMTEHENTSDSFLLKISVELGGRICHSTALLQQHVSPKRRKRKHKHTSEGGFTQHLKYYSDTHVNRETPRRPNRNNPVNRFRSICPSENRSVSN